MKNVHHRMLLTMLLWWLAAGCQSPARDHATEDGGGAPDASVDHATDAGPGRIGNGAGGHSAVGGSGGLDGGRTTSSGGSGGRGAAGHAASSGGDGTAGHTASSGGSGGAGRTGSGGAAGGTGHVGDPGALDGGTGNGFKASLRQTAHPAGSGNTAPNGYYEYLPPGYGNGLKPLLAFFHGIGQDGNGGTDLHNVLAYGPPKLIDSDQWPASRPFVVLSPQYTAQGGAIAPGQGCPSGSVVDAFLTWAIGHYSVDPKQVYLTGLSCGAIGSWDYLGSHRDVVAAAVLISGNPGDPNSAGSVWQRAGCGLGDVAVWSLHGDADDVVPYAPDHDTLEKLMGCASPPRRAAIFTDVAGAGHAIWDATYMLAHGDIFQWMLDNAKP